jgi:hypothetical protein
LPYFAAARSLSAWVFAVFAAARLVVAVASSDFTAESCATTLPASPRKFPVHVPSPVWHISSISPAVGKEYHEEILPDFATLVSLK